jgi:hypothetical protein
MDWGRYACVYMTQLESLQDVAKKFSSSQKPEDVAEYLKVMRLMNSFNQLWNPAFSQSNRIPMQPHSCICLPTARDMKEYQTHISKFPNIRTQKWLVSKEHWLDAARSSNREYFSTREVVASLVQDHDLETTGSVALLLQEMEKENRPKITAEGIGLTGIEQVADYVTENAKEVTTAMLEVEEKLKAFLEAPKGLKTAAKEAYVIAHRKLKEKFAHYLKEDRATREGMRKLEFVNNREKWLLRWKTGIPNSSVVDIGVFKSITKMAQRATVLDRGVIGIHIGLATEEVWSTYQKHGDWQRKLSEESLGFGASMIGGWLGEPVVVGLFCLGPEGWIIILVSTALAVSFEYGGEWVGGKGYDWLKEKIRDLSSL